MGSQADLTSLNKGEVLENQLKTMKQGFYDLFFFVLLFLLLEN